MPFLSLFLLGTIATSPVRAESDAVEMPDISVKAQSLKLHDEISYTPHSVVIERPASDVYLGETLGKLPGILVRNTSGFASTTTVISAQALGSAGTAVSIDDIPVIESSGRGVNFSLFPSALIGSIEHHSPFYPSMDPTADALPAPGGRINLKTLRAPKPGGIPVIGAVTVGSGHSIETTLGLRGGDRDHDWVAGVSGYNTQGDYSFRNPLTGGDESRANNDAVGLGGLGKYRWRLANDATFEALEFVSNSNRTNPGSLFAPTRQHQKDTFNLLGARYQGPHLLGPRDGVFAKTAVGFARTATEGPSAGQSNSGVTTDSRTVGNYAQAGYVRRNETMSFTLAADNEFDYLRTDEGVFNRNVFGATATVSVELDKFRIVPLVRQDASSVFPSTTDGSLSVIYVPDSDNEVAISYGLSHSFPAITSVGGFTNGGLSVLPNPDLHVQRDSLVSLTFDRRKPKYTLYGSAFYDLVRNRSTFTFVSNTAAQFVNLSSVSVIGYTLDGQLFPTDALSLRGSVTLGHAWDRSSGHEMPYKPRIEGSGSVSYLFHPKVGVTAQEQFIGKRFVSSTGVSSVDPFIQTIIRLDAQVAGGVLFFKVANLFDVGGFENPGFPFAGRSYWLGYTLGSATL